ncbi:uncharacterized protein LOC112568577 [Pomacea canaliculata]|uniref:uncharacterized protein LOC112568577 n=1 Tax=Pomacea canaliculata TaxID=400727 RepID=UPI000D73276E|nr:uncharacterized protein LOC112568577 [Pomacea canaliculata]
MYNTTSDSSNFSLWNSAHDIKSFNEYIVTMLVLHCVVKPVVVVVGVPSNIISCVVFWRQGLGDRMNVCLLALSLVDLCLLLVSVVFTVGYYLEQIDSVNYSGLYAFLLAFLYGVNQGFRSASGCITMVIAVERCLCVQFPLKAANLLSSYIMIVIMVCIVCFTQLGFFTAPAASVMVEVTNGSSKFVTTLSEFYINNQVLCDILEGIVMMSVLPLTTFLVTCLSTCLTVVKLRAAMTWRGQVSSSSSDKGQGQQMALTKMLVVVSCVYILTTIPWVIFYMAVLMVEDFSSQGQYNNVYWTSAVIANHLAYINSSISFYIYLRRSTRFRRDVYTLFRCSSINRDNKALNCSQKQ